MFGTKIIAIVLSILIEFANNPLLITEVLAENRSEVVIEGEYAELKAEVFDLVNQYRIEEGLNVLEWERGMELAATVRAKEAQEFFSHTRPDGTMYWTVNSSLVYGENLSRGYNTSESIVNAWMQSESHRDNILYPEFRTVCLGVYVEDGYMTTSLLFGY